ncbi:DUF421 domain-containing protein [Bacillus mycoides]|jgi:uncharacterized membrane protein YcaP (DUF421 family)|uniref:YetF C-terminal domain-containing protein n=2 Tax=Bacillus cereus group TaxID=86661 RepID=J8YG52_BACCE|nr:MULTISPECIES: DUF421 domain-containing protein [Bacillus cereus group]ABY45420.1 protein of unknown function DUF421 [Bacillus mycoides KBAB4]EJV81333.1 hypothetical protein IG3_04022 [Bacillus cereus HuA2-1]EOO19219.1 hypothetical protein IG9_02063 [Bacillus cereus HuA2-9]MCZ6939447.1 DUF421 domain-containing protein [Bacillus mycoides]MED1402310.1 DUF421 domain-containing protein [Bacillus mycoides]
MEWVSIIGRTMLLYIIILIIFRLMGKREIGELSVLDLVVFIMLGEMAVVAIENTDKSLWHQLVPMTFLMCIQIILSVISLKFQRFRHLIEGEPAILVNAGKIDEKKMRKQRYNIDDLLMQLREQGIGDVRDVEYAILEPSGKLSVFQKQKSKKSKNDTPIFTLPLIIDGEIQYNHLQMIEHTNEWLVEKLNNLGYKDVKQILYCSFQNGQFFVDLKEN